MSLFVESECFIGRDDFGWFPAPKKTEYGEDMWIADIAADKDHTVTLFTEGVVTRNFDIKVIIKRKDDSDV